ncbi:MAG: type I-E CRISPR-associated protein Cas7/Cse4/CasC [Clostridiaceae bacterium]|nr:type I-E CRISPR-associated protein Cas7/Cse4/CasC [Clostridiaceae bacterium]
MKQINNNPYRSIRIEFHILQSFPVTCLNRDDVGAPKTAIVGGTTRARVSSQCWKRYIRLAMKELDVNIGSRTKLIHKLITKACIDLNATEEQAQKCGHDVAAVFIKEKKGKKENTEEDIDATETKSDALIFLSPSEIIKIASALKSNGFSTEFSEEKIDKNGQVKIATLPLAKKVESLIGKPNYALDGLDIALFGRMVAQAATLNVEAAASFAHAISTHKVTNEVEFFTAIDDCQEEPGSGHMGSLEFNSATYYRYVCLDVGQLWENLAGQNILESIESFIKALYLAVPGARQTTQSGACPWEFAKIYIRKGQRLQVPFETAVKSKNGGFLEASKEELCGYLDKKEKLSGSLFGKIQAYCFGEDASFNIDDLITNIKSKIERV